MRLKHTCRMVRRNNGVHDILLIADAQYGTPDSIQSLVLFNAPESEGTSYRVGEDYFVEIRPAFGATPLP